MNEHKFMKWNHIIISISLPFALFAFSQSCTVKQLRNSKSIIEVKDAGKPFDTMMYLNKDHWRWSMTILGNTLDDTAKIGIIKIWPRKTGVLFTIDCRIDSIPFNYHPYKASKGKLVVEYNSGNY